MVHHINTTPNLDATQHGWVESLVRFTFSIEYQKRRDSVAADTLCWATLKLDTEIVKYILDGVIMETTKWANAQDPVVAKADEDIHKPVQETTVLAKAAQTHVNLHVTDRVTTQ